MFLVRKYNRGITENKKSFHRFKNSKPFLSKEILQILTGPTSLVLLTGKLSILNSTISKNTKHQKKYKE